MNTKWAYCTADCGDAWIVSEHTDEAAYKCPKCRVEPSERIASDADYEADWTLTYEKATPLYIGPLPHYTRRMLQALDAYWLHCDGLPTGHYPLSRSTAEDWWGRFEKYRALVEAQL